MRWRWWVCPCDRVLRLVQDQRDARYNLLRGYFHGADDDTVAERDQERMATLTLPPGAQTLGKPWATWLCTPWGERGQLAPQQWAHVHRPRDATVLAEGDTLVLSGHPAALALAEDRLLRG